MLLVVGTRILVEGTEQPRASAFAGLHAAVAAEVERVRKTKSDAGERWIGDGKGGTDELRKVD
jgi:hypothetical protein